MKENGFIWMKNVNILNLFLKVLFLWIQNKLSENKEFIYDKEKKYLLLPIRSSDDRLLWILQVYRNSLIKTKSKLKHVGSNQVMLKGELTLFQLFSTLIGSHIENILHNRITQIKIKDIYRTADTIIDILKVKNEFLLIK